MPKQLTALAIKRHATIAAERNPKRTQPPAPRRPRKRTARPLRPTAPGPKRPRPSQQQRARTGTKEAPPQQETQNSRQKTGQEPRTQGAQSAATTDNFSSCFLVYTPTLVYTLGGLWCIPKRVLWVSGVYPVPWPVRRWSLLFQPLWCFRAYTPEGGWYTPKVGYTPIGLEPDFFSVRAGLQEVPGCKAPRPTGAPGRPPPAAGNLGGARGAAPPARDGGRAWAPPPPVGRGGPEPGRPRGPGRPPAAGSQRGRPTRARRIT